MKKIIFSLLAFILAAGNLNAQTGNVFRYNSGAEPQSLDPQIVNTVDAANIVTQLFEGLVYPGAKEIKARPGVAEKWEISPDGKVYTFHLRKDAKWSDGKPITAYDFEYAWERGDNPKTASQTATRFQYIKNGKEYLAGKIKDPKLLGFKAIDPLTFRVELDAPFPLFLDLISMPTFAPVRKDVVEKFGDKWTRPENMISNGPFNLKEWKPYDKLVLVKNPNYWDAKNVFLNEIVAYTIEDLETALKRYSSGDLDFIDLLPQIRLATLAQHPDFRTVPLFGLYYYPINVKRPVLSDPRVRKALSLAVDRDTLINQVLRTKEKPATGNIPPGVAGYTYEKLIGYNPVQAKKLLAEAGFPDGKGFPVLTISYNTMERHKIIAETIQQMWKKNLGIDVKLLNEEWKTHVSNLQAHNFDIARLGGIAEYVYPNTCYEEYIGNTAGNYSQFSNAEFDKLWNESTEEADPKKRLALYENMDKILSDQMPDIPLYFYALYTMTKPHVEGLFLKPNQVYTFKDIRFKK